MATIENINIRDIDRYIHNPGYLIVDVRNAKDYRNYHIEGAVNVPYERILNGEAGLPAGRTLVVYCEHGGISIMAANKLLKEGHRVINTIGGMSAYRREKQI